VRRKSAAAGIEMANDLPLSSREFYRLPNLHTVEAVCNFIPNDQLRGAKAEHAARCELHLRAQHHAIRRYTANSHIRKVAWTRAMLAQIDERQNFFCHERLAV